MNFEFSDEQNQLREQALSMLRSKSGPGVVRRVLENDKEPYAKDVWREIVNLGWTASTIPEEFGGIGLTHLEVCVLAEELGRATAPVPFSSSVYLATEALLMAGSQAQKDKWLPKLAAGEVIGTFALAEGGGTASAKALKTKFKDDGLRGEKLAVPDGDVADFAIVVAGSRHGDRASWYLAELTDSDVKRKGVTMIDPTRSHANIKFKGASAEPLGKDGHGWELTRGLLDRAAVLYAWEQVGGAQAALDQAKEYALGRYAFGRPIASYQAIKHKLAMAYVKNTLARSNCYFGAWALSTLADELPTAAATARVSATQAYHYASKENIQTHGGMGFTWEFDCQFHYRRSKLLATNIGSEVEWSDRLVTALEASAA